jgi:hypothetical protein
MSGHVASYVRQIEADNRDLQREVADLTDRLLLSDRSRDELAADLLELRERLGNAGG